ncbi:MAG: mechanosensitive ion channel family protein [Rhodobacterales bacterium]|nr:mechanosensitive ion channel family protein [Rhodobacterales bacterium]
MIARTDLRVVAIVWRVVFLRALVAAWLILLSAIVASAQNDTEAEAFAFEVARINEGLPAVEPPPRLDTPRAALESFLSAVDADDALGAAQTLNLSGIPEEERAEQGPRLAMMLAYLLLHHDLIDWSEVPDQPDARVLPDVQSTVAPYSRRAIQIGELQLDGRPVPISLQRFQVEGTEPVWLFAPFAVERVADLYAASRPGLLSEWIPLRQRIDTLGQPSLREWLIITLTFVVCLLLGMVIYWLTRWLARHAGWQVSRWLRRAALPLSTMIAALVFRIGITRLILLTGPVASYVDIGSELVAMITGVWLLNLTLAAVTLSLSERYVVPLSTEDPSNRRVKTNVYVVRRLTVVLIAVLSIGYILLRIGLFETFGISVLASAGALGVIVAIAAQPLLGNMVAGLQIALSDPVRIGDVVMFDGHWATVEDISFAHTVLHTDRDTRLVVPHADFLSRAVENWSKDGEAVKRIVKLPVDYRIDVDLIREEVRAIVDDDPRLTEAPTVEMVDVSDGSAMLWIWVPATTPATAWSLHNELREKLMRFLSDFQDGAYLPTRRYMLAADTRMLTEAERTPFPIKPETF